MAPRRGTPLWITLGCGCVLLVALVIGAAVTVGYLGVSEFRDYLSDLKDPASRSAKAAEMLGASRLPEGYVGQLYFRIPWVFDLVVLSDGEPVAIAGEDDVDLDAAAVGEHLFLYVELRSKESDEDIDRMLRGERTAEGVQADIGLELDPDEELGGGAFELPPQSLRWVAHRGEMELDQDDFDGIYSRVIIDCPADDKTRVAVWFRRDPETPAAAPADATGSPADEAALRRFMGHFNVCAD